MDVEFRGECTRHSMFVWQQWTWDCMGTESWRQWLSAVSFLSDVLDLNSAAVQLWASDLNLCLSFLVIKWK